MATSKRFVRPPRSFPIRFFRLHGKLLIGTAVGFVVLAAAPLAHLPMRILVGWDVGVFLYLLMIRWTVARADANHIRRRAAEQDESAFAILLLTMIATFASLVAVIFALGGAKQAAHGEAIELLALTVATILLSWTFVHTIFALHYAHEYYGERSDGIVGGLNFPGDQSPDYWDFFYFSVVIGMTSQVSDVAITSPTIRRVATMHGVLSFFFNVTVLALSVNMVSNFI